MSITSHDLPTLATASLGPDTGRLVGSVALVTGAGRGIGRVVAEAFAAAGAAVALVARSADELAETVERIEAAGGNAAAAVADVTDGAGLAAAVADLRRLLGPIDLLVNNAGVLGPVGPLWELDLDAWWTTMDVNVRGIVLCSQLVLPAMVRAGRGRIINITSQAGAHRWPLASSYSVSKAAVIKLTENLALETRRHGVGVFSVHPGLLPIGMSETVAGTTPGPGTKPASAPGPSTSLPRVAARSLGVQSTWSCGSRPVTATASRAGTCRCTTISTPCWPGWPRSTLATSTSSRRPPAGRRQQPLIESANTRKEPP